MVLWSKESDLDACWNQIDADQFDHFAITYIYIISFRKNRKISKWYFWYILYLVPLNADVFQTSQSLLGKSYPRIQRRDDSSCLNQEDCGSWRICDWETGGGTCAGCKSGVNCDDYQNIATKYQCYNECQQMEKCKSSIDYRL